MTASAWGEAGYGIELAGLVADFGLRSTRVLDAAPAMLIPVLMAADTSLAILRAWLRRPGHTVSTSHIRVNVSLP